MPSRRTRAHADGGDEVINTESPGTEPDPPVLSRTRSGRAVRTIVAPTPKTPTRRSRKAAIQEESVQELSSDKCDAEIDQCSPSAADPASAADTQDSPPVLLDSAALTGSDRISEKENVVDNTEVCSTGSTDPEKKAKKRTHSESSERKDKMIPLGKPKSGRVWKDRNKQRFSALLRDKPLRTSWEKKMEAKREKQLVKQYHQQLKDEQTKEKEERKRRRAENLKRRAENERKAEIVQVIKNTAKIKRMKKKQLRKVEKRDTLSMVQKTPPSVKKGPSKESNSLSGVQCTDRCK